jgi:hypothetical protein
LLERGGGDRRGSVDAVSVDAVSVDAGTAISSRSV